MAYPAYDTYHNQVAFPRQYSAYNGDYAYHDPITAGAYGENYPQPAYPIYAPTRTASQYAGGGYHYDDYDGHYPEAGYSTPYAPGIRQRRASSMSHRTRPRLDSYHRRYSSTIIKFKRKGGFRSGITLGEAMSNVRLSGNDSYTYHDLGVDHRGKIILKIRWTGYTSMTYEIPVDTYDGHIQLQTVARRIARACVHFLQANMIPISWDRVILYHLEENSPGVWQPVLSTS